MLDDEGRLTVTQKNNEISLRLVNSSLGEMSLTPTRRGNEVRYSNITQGVDVRYYYFPRKVKEEIILNEPLVSIPENGVRFTFEQTGELGEFEFERPYVCDAARRCMYLNLSELGGNLLEIVVPASYFERDLEYPIVIDPTLSMDSDWITWSAYVQYDGNEYVRYEDPAQLPLVNNSEENVVVNAGFEWLADTIPDDATVQNLTLQIYVIGGEWNNIYAHELLYHETYSDETSACEGNCMLFEDMAKGTLLGESMISGEGFLNLTMNAAGRLDFEEDSESGEQMWGVGLVTDSLSFIEVGGRYDTNASRRPRLTAIYGASNSDGNAAIDLGINHSLPANPVVGNKQVYVVNEWGQHYLGRFDKTTILNNQTWAFNYVMGDDIFTYTPSLFKVLNVWENTSLAYNQIVNQVEVFINATRY
jgi:hypothetical protein